MIPILPLLAITALVLPPPPYIYERPYTEMVATISAYSEYDSCHTGKDCLMASGKPAYVGAVACPRRIPLGVEIKIDGRYYKCEDRLALKYDDRIDIFHGYGKEAYKKALEYGLREKRIQIYGK